ncbi:ABC transporter permease [Aquiflexum sp. TKW24L]|uniref:ABC transporter permease n=1 Tax=Aquiflexum sp. TKW24L TaxID=2942212 RepID=UPI0020BF7D27|nr:ABC transporter permease [Aquiflexum sp. TKW24L]MCL6257572.1 ABC transporter permease [Aquiflexum sp. TKW24L]
MIRNYLLIGWRNLKRNKLRTGIHILGLSIGISICFLIFNIVWYSHSFDKFHPDSGNIFRVGMITDFGDGEFSNSAVPGPLGEVVDSELTGIADKGRLYTLWETLVILPESNKVMGRSNTVTFSDAGFFKIFPRKWLAGSPENSLENPNSAVISLASLEKYFPEQQPLDVLGKEIIYSDSDTISAQVTGVVADFEENTDLVFTDFISYSTIKSLDKENWYGLDSWGNVNSSSQLFIKKEASKTESDLITGLDKISEKNLNQEGGSSRFTLQPLAEVHFDQSDPGSQSVSKVFLKGLIFIGLIILTLACLNFINLETAQAIGRAKEVGIRKTLGGDRSQLVFQFLSETYLIVFFSCLLSIVLTEGLAMVFKNYLPSGLEVDYLSLENLGFLAVISIVLTLLAGIYPSLILANYDPQRALKGEKEQSGKFSIGVFLRKNLAVLQFASSIAFIILVSVISFQMKYLSSQPLGFERDAVMFTQLPFMAGVDKAERIRERISQFGFVKNASLSGDVVSSDGLWTSDLYVPKDTSESRHIVQVKNVDSAFVAVNGLKVLAGKTGSNQKDEIMVNEAFAKEIGVANPDEVVGLMVRFGATQRKIVGVVNDFNSRTLREEIRPMVLSYIPEGLNVLNVKLENGYNLALAKTEMEGIFKEVYPYDESEFKFLDEAISKFYEEDLKIRNVLGMACILAIVISALGLFGLSSFTIAQRTKEISIRKVLGASVLQILGLISKEYVILILVSFVLAVYPAYYFLNQWLDSFSYKVEMPYFIYFLSGLGVMLLCLLIVGIHSYMAAQTNPAEILKDE